MATAMLRSMSDCELWHPLLGPQLFQVSWVSHKTTFLPLRCSLSRTHSCTDTTNTINSFPFSLCVILFQPLHHNKGRESHRHTDLQRQTCFLPVITKWAGNGSLFLVSYPSQTLLAKPDKSSLFLLSVEGWGRERPGYFLSLFLSWKVPFPPACPLSGKPHAVICMLLFPQYVINTWPKVISMGKLVNLTQGKSVHSWSGFFLLLSLSLFLSQHAHQKGKYDPFVQRPLLCGYDFMM